MQLKRSIKKNFPFNIISIEDSPRHDFVMKGLFQQFIEISNQYHIIDVISVPSELKMGKIQLCIDQVSCKYNKSQYLFISNQMLSIGSPNSDKFNMQLDNILISDSIFMSNPVKLRPSQYCNISLNCMNQSKINIFSLEQNIKITYKQIPLSFNISHNSNLSYQNDTIFYISNNPIQETIICYDLNNEEVSTCFELPEIQMQNGMNCFLVSQSDNKYREILCAYGRDWLAIADVRMKNLIGLQKLYDCESVFSVGGNNNLKIYYTQGNKIYQFDIRKYSRKRTPFLIHKQNILNASPLNNNLIKIQDNCTCGVYLYQYSNQQV